MNDKMKIDEVDQSSISKELPSNSKLNASKDTVVERKVQKVITGKAIQRKKPLSRKFAEIFMGEGNDVQSVSEYVVKDILIPAAKGTFLDMISTLGDMVRASVEMSLFGTTSSTNRHRNRNSGSSGRSYTSYDKYSSSKNNNRDRDRDRERKPSTDHNKSSHSFDGITLETRGEADEVIKCLIDLSLDYGVVSVADLYDLVDLTSNFADNNYGWTELNTHNATFTRGRYGYTLNLPRTKPIN